MLKDTDYKLAHSHETFYGDKRPLGVRISIAAGTDLTEDTQRAIRRAADTIFNAVLKQHVMQDEEVKKYATNEKAEILALFEGRKIYVEEIPNGYGGEDPYYCLYPWFIVTTEIGRIKIGWRKRVINIDWTDTLQKKKGNELFPEEKTTVSSDYDECRYVHAWSYEKAKEYLEKIHKLC